MEFIKGKLRTMKQEETWDYGNDFKVLRSGADWIIYKNNWLDVRSDDIDEIARHIKLTFISIEVMDKMTSERAEVEAHE